MTEEKPSFFARVRRYVITGTLTAIPIWITWLVFLFFARLLSGLGSPWVKGASQAIYVFSPTVSQWLLEPWFQSALSLLMALATLYFLGWAAAHVIGRRIIESVERLIKRIPLAQTIYSSTKTLLVALQQKPERVERVVLINFPSAEMKTIGFVTRVMRDEKTGEELAAVYVPTTPNPTSGYLEIVPVTELTSTSWSMDEAMSFVISGGAVAPDRIKYSREPSEKDATGGENRRP